MIPTDFFVLSVVRRADTFLLVHERKHGQLWYLPAGRVDPGESFVAAARRETFEEASIDIAVEGLIRIEHNPAFTRARVRLFFAASPVGDSTPKSIADEHSLAAGWFTTEQISRLPLRGREALDACTYVQGGGAIAPMSVLANEGSTFNLV